MIERRAAWSLRRLVSPLLSILPWAIAVAGTGLTMRSLWPTPMEGATSGIAAVVVNAVDAYPLLFGIVLFLLFLATSQYWLQWAQQRFSWLTTTAHVSPAVPSRLRGAIALVSCAALALFVRASLVCTYRVVSPSMVPTLNVGDRVVVNQIAYGLRAPIGHHAWTATLPHRGDIVVFRDDGTHNAGVGPKVLVKRVIGLPGDFVAFREGAAWVNGWAVPSCDAGPFVTAVGPLTIRGRLAVEFLEDHAYLTLRTPLDEEIFRGYRVPDGEIFVVGDDRGMSSDSRVWNEGRGAGVAVDRIVGRVSRLAIATTPEGRPDVTRLFAALRLGVRQPDVDLAKTEQRISSCLTTRPLSAPPTAQNRR